MSFLNAIIETLDRLSPPETAYAHCDVPCGIYDPHAAQIAAQTVQAMVTKMQALTPPAQGDLQSLLAFENTVTRMITTKEDHAEICKREILILWTDYFKPPHFERWPDLHMKVNQACKTASQCKQEVNAEAAQRLRDQVEEIAAIFWESKK